jgi:hypothetical protein
MKVLEKYFPKDGTRGSCTVCFKLGPRNDFNSDHRWPIRFTFWAGVCSKECAINHIRREIHDSIESWKNIKHLHRTYYRENTKAKLVFLLNILKEFENEAP